MFGIRVTLLLCVTVFAVAAEFTQEELVAFVDQNDDKVISEQEFNNWINAWFDYKETPTIMGMTGEIPKETFEEVIDSHPSDSGYTGEQAANFADKDGDGEISASEFDRWFKLLPKGTDKTETVFAFTGNIPVDDFHEYLTENKPETEHDPGYTVEQAVAYANENNDDEIDAHEFSKWYNGVKYFTAQHVEPLMKGEDGIISLEEFLAVIANL